MDAKTLATLAGFTALISVDPQEHNQHSGKGYTRTPEQKKANAKRKRKNKLAKQSRRRNRG